MILAALAYLIGAIPFGWILGRVVHGVDVRRQGSGNIGATNVSRVLGWKWGAAALLLDLLKGLLPVLLLPGLLPGSSGSNAERVVAAAASVVGHMFPCYLGFRGGKGVATGLGAATALCWPAALAGAAAFGLTFAVVRIVSLSSICAVFAYAAAALIAVGQPWSQDNLPLSLFSLAVPVLIVFQHRTNIARLLRGEEPRFRFGRGTVESPKT
jgi:glycerol-3-phosphate acyltransferase PlsY